MPGYVYKGTEPIKRRMARGEIPPCGTESACVRHRRLKEPVDEACRRAAADACKARRDAKKKAT